MKFFTSFGADCRPNEEIVAFARGKIANFKVPKYVEVVERFPLTGSGKVQKFKQKAYAVEKYALRGP